MKLEMDTRPFPFRVTGARVAVLGYGSEAAQQAKGLRDAGNQVAVATRPGGLSWVHAHRDGFATAPACTVVERASVVLVHVPDDEQAPVYWDASAPNAEPHALLVFSRGLALATRAFAPGALDVVLVAAEGTACRVAVHNDATGRALERAISYARAAFDLDVAIATTLIAAEAEAELAAHEARAGGAAALRTEVATAVARMRYSHAPEEARLAYYEGLLGLVEDRARRSARDGDRATAPPLAYGPTRGMS
jgi:ketol-acid reductoisomerase